MRLKNTLKTENITYPDLLISSFYDNEMTVSNSIEFEVKVALSNALKEYYYEQMFENFKISNSMNLAKIRLKNHSEKYTTLILKSRRYENGILFFNIYSVLFKSFNKFFGS